MDESFRNWIKNPTPELNHRWSEWLEQNKDKEVLALQAEEVIRGIQFKEYSADSATKARILNHIKADSIARGKKAIHLNLFFKIAALLLLSVGLGGSLMYIFKNDINLISSNKQQRVKENAIGQKSKIMLSDGTVVYLNSTSKLTYPTAFDTDERVVYLSGEAYFDVTPNPARPFRVKTDALDVLVLGTEFNVKTKDSNYDISLVEGKVRLITESNAKTELSPGQQVSFNKESQVFSYNSFDTKFVTGWKDGSLAFRNSSFTEVMDQLHEWYGIHITFNKTSQIQNWSYTATFENESLENVLQNMSALRHFEYSIKNDTLVVILD